jgi:chaperonin cofactor prefoldin
MNTSYNLKILDKNISTLSINLKKNEIVNKEIDNLSEETKLYDRCGRIFVLSSKKSIQEKLGDNRKKMINELESQNEKKKILEHTANEQANHYNEIVKTLGK